MKAFEMDCTLIKIVAVNGVPEFKGENRDHGLSVTFERMFDNTILDEFDSDLRVALYKKGSGKLASGANEDGQEEMALPQPGVKLTARKCQSIQMPIKLRKELVGWQIVYHRGASEQSAIKAGDVKFSDFTLVDACEGGSCLLRFKAYQKLPPEVQGYVDHMAQTSVECTFRMPENKQEDLVDQAQGQAQNRKSNKKKTVAEKIEEEGDPLAGSDLARGAPNGPKDDAAPSSTEHWPFPRPGDTHNEGEPPTDDETEEESETE